jgi:hypothetical protein
MSSVDQAIDDFMQTLSLFAPEDDEQTVRFREALATLSADIHQNMGYIFVGGSSKLICAHTIDTPFPAETTSIATVAAPIFVPIMRSPIA